MNAHSFPAQRPRAVATALSRTGASSAPAHSSRTAWVAGLCGLLCSVALAQEATATTSRQVQRDPGAVQGQITGPAGQSASRQVQRSAEGASGQVTGPGGQTATRQVQRTAEQTSATLTGPNGQTVTRQSKRAPGQGSTTVTGPGGQSVGTSTSVQ